MRTEPPPLPRAEPPPPPRAETSSLLRNKQGRSYGGGSRVAVATLRVVHDDHDDHDLFNNFSVIAHSLLYRVRNNQTKFLGTTVS